MVSARNPRIRVIDILGAQSYLTKPDKLGIVDKLSNAAKRGMRQEVKSSFDHAHFEGAEELGSGPETRYSADAVAGKADLNGVMAAFSSVAPCCFRELKNQQNLAILSESPSWPGEHKLLTWVPRKAAVTGDERTAVVEPMSSSSSSATRSFTEVPEVIHPNYGLAFDDTELPIGKDGRRAVSSRSQGKDSASRLSTQSLRRKTRKRRAAQPGRSRVCWISKASWLRLPRRPLLEVDAKNPARLVGAGLASAQDAIVAFAELARPLRTKNQAD